MIWVEQSAHARVATIGLPKPCAIRAVHEYSGSRSQDMSNEGDAMPTDDINKMSPDELDAEKERLEIIIAELQAGIAESNRIIEEEREKIEKSPEYQRANAKIQKQIDRLEAQEAARQKAEDQARMHLAKISPQLFVEVIPKSHFFSSMMEYATEAQFTALMESNLLTDAEKELAAKARAGHPTSNPGRLWILRPVYVASLVVIVVMDLFNWSGPGYTLRLFAESTWSPTGDPFGNFIINALIVAACIVFGFGLLILYIGLGVAALIILAPFALLLWLAGLSPVGAIIAICIGAGVPAGFAAEAYFNRERCRAARLGIILGSVVVALMALLLTVPRLLQT